MRLKISSRVWLIIILLAGFALRVYRLGAESLWYDETVSLLLAQKDLIALTRHTAGDIHPPLYYYLLHLWGNLAGWSEFSAAFLSVLFGMLLVALVYRVAREWFDARVALIAALLTALSPYNVWYAQEVRMYTLGAFLGLASVWLLVESLKSKGKSLKSRTLISAAYVLVSVAGIYTLYYFVFLLIFENLVALGWVIQNSKFKILNSKSRVTNDELRITNYEFRIWLFSQLAVVLLYVPWLPIAFRQATDPPVPPWRSFVALPDVLVESFSALVLGQAVDPKAVWPVLVVMVMVIAFAFRRMEPSKREQTSKEGEEKKSARQAQQATRHSSPVIRHPSLFLFAYTFVPLALIYIISLWKPLYHVRYVFTYSPAFYILLALGFTSLVTRHPPLVTRLLSLVTRLLSLVTFALWLATSVYSLYNFWYNPQYAADDLRGAVQHIQENWRPDDVILVNAGYAYPALVYYFRAPIADRVRLSDYQPRENDAHAAPLVLMTGSIGGNASLGWGSPESDFYATTAEATTTALDRVFATHPRVWMLRLYDTVVDPNGVIRDYLARNGRLIDDEVFTGESNARVQGYETPLGRPRDLPANVQRLEVVLGSRVMLVGVGASGQSLAPGEAYDVNLYWRATKPLNANYHLFVGVYDANEQLVASAEEMPLGSAYPATRWEVGGLVREPARVQIPATATAGLYTVEIALFDPGTREPLVVGDPRLRVGDERVRVGTFRIVR